MKAPSITPQQPSTINNQPSTTCQPSTPDGRPPGLPFPPHPKESPKAFQAFLAYLDIGHNRNLRQVAQTTGVHLRTLRDWSRRFQWTARVRDYNAHLLQARIAAEIAATKDQVELWARRTAAFKEREWAAADKLLALAQRCLDALHAKDPEQITLADVSRALDVATKIGRLSLGLANQKAEHTPDNDCPHMIEFEASLRKIYGPVVDVDAIPDPLPNPLPDNTPPPTANQPPPALSATAPP